MGHPLAGLPETDGHARHVDVAELVHPRRHVRADKTDMMGEIETRRRSISEIRTDLKCETKSKRAAVIVSAFGIRIWNLLRIRDLRFRSRGFAASAAGVSQPAFRRGLALEGRLRRLAALALVGADELQNGPHAGVAQARLGQAQHAGVAAGPIGEAGRDVAEKDLHGLLAAQQLQRPPPGRHHRGDRLVPLGPAPASE